MAKFECELRGNFDEILNDIENTVLGKSISATKEDQSDFYAANSRCATRVYERFSYIGSNRVSLNITLFGSADGRIFFTAITSGGSQAVFFKINTFGEHSFLDTISDTIRRYII